MNAPEYSAVRSVSDYLAQKAIRMKVPLSGTFELSPVCNFNCRMCYVRKSEREVAESPRGILTLEDILEQLVGEIWDEQDVVEPELECLQTDIYRVDGSMRILDLLEELDVDDRDFDEENATVGGWAIDMLGDYAEVGDSFSYRNLTFTVTEIENLRVLKMIVQVAAEEDEGKK